MIVSSTFSPSLATKGTFPILCMLVSTWSEVRRTELDMWSRDGGGAAESTLVDRATVSPDYAPSLPDSLPTCTRRSDNTLL